MPIRLNFKALVSFVLFGLAVSTSFSACSDTPPPAASVGFTGGTPRPVGSPCDADEVRPCSITLAEKAGVLECYHGTQACEDGRWGTCGNGAVTEQASLAAPVGIRALALSEAEDCINNPCNPFCQWYVEVPEEPISAIGDGSTWYDWDAGSLADLPGALVEQGLNQPCGSGVDCQFNTRCENPPLDTCAHSVCETGIPLTESCNECAAMVQQLAEANPAAYGQCFGAAPDPTAEECIHDPCSVGTALKANCAPQVALVCADSEFAGCCDEVWDAACVARFKAIAPGVCQCGVGEVSRGDACLFQIPAGLSWSEARETCRDHGDDWDLVWIEDATENDFIRATWIPNADVSRWVGLSDQVTEGQWVWSSGALPGAWEESTASGVYANWCGANGPAGAPACPGGLVQPVAGPERSCARMNQTGAWEAVDCANTLAASVCKGPPLHAAVAGLPQCASAAEYHVNWARYIQGDVGTVEHAFEPGEYQINVVAAGEHGGDAWPQLRLLVGSESIGLVNATSVTWQTYTFDVSIEEAGTLPITVRFENDFFGGEGEDRNLYVDSIEILCPGAAPASGTWGSECVGAAEATCDIRCDVERPNTGSCVPWLPGETDPTCPDRADLSVGVPCDGTIPVCNHGQQAAPAGVTVVHLPESAAQFASPTPDLTGPDVVTCTTPDPIPPGECISLPASACSDVMTGTRDVMVNPPGDDAIDECSGLDNWAIAVEGTSCDAPLCFGGSTSSTVVRRPVDIIFVIDNSSSMQEEIQAVEARINEDFAEIIESSGLDYRVIMVSRYGDVTQPFGSAGSSAYPICVGPPLGSNACTDPSNEVPVPSERFLHYSANVGSNDALCLLLDGFSAPDELAVADRPGWQIQAPNGFGAWLRPEAFKTFVVITDDNVDCTTASNITFDDGETAAAGTAVADAFDVALRTLAPSQFQDDAGGRGYIWHSIVNIPENSPADAPWPPEAPISTGLCSGPPGNYVGPGTGYQALSVLTGGLRYPSCRTSDFDAVFNAIAQEVIGQSELNCSFGVDGDGVDLDAARVSFTRGDDEKVTVSEVGSSGDCDGGGWYLATSGDVSTVNLCPVTCQEIQADPGAQLFVEFGCEVVLNAVTETQVYEATCPSGTIVEWKAVGYDTSIEDGGTVAFSVRTAVTEDELASATYVPVNTATASQPDCVYLQPMTCVADDRACNCVEVDGQAEGIGGGVVLDGEVLDALASHHRYLELKIEVTPDLVEMSSPMVESWKVAYSCLPGE